MEVTSRGRLSKMLDDCLRLLLLGPLSRLAARSGARALCSLPI